MFICVVSSQRAYWRRPQGHALLPKDTPPALVGDRESDLAIVQAHAAAAAAPPPPAPAGVGWLVSDPALYALPVPIFKTRILIQCIGVARTLTDASKHSTCAGGGFRLWMLPLSCLHALSKFLSTNNLA